MSRCLSCNKNLNDKESVRKYASTGEYLDLCDGCFSHIKDDVTITEGAAFKNYSYNSDTNAYEEGSDDNEDQL